MYIRYVDTSYTLILSCKYYVSFEQSSAKKTQQQQNKQNN